MGFESPKSIKKYELDYSSKFVLFSSGGLVRVKYAHRTPPVFRAPAKILHSKRFVGKGATDRKVIATCIFAGG